MDSILKSDLFFFITSVAVVLVSAVVVVVLIYIVRIMRDIRDIASTLKHQTESLSQDIDELRSKVKEEGWPWSKLTGFLGKFVKKKSRG